MGSSTGPGVYPSPCPRRRWGRMTELTVEWQFPEFRARVVFEMTRRNAYCYLIIDGRISSDVWLFNVGEAPSEPEWGNPRNAPFLNLDEYCANEPFDSSVGVDDLACECIPCAQASRILSCNLSIRGHLHAILEPGQKPGFCRLALKDGPVARRLRA